MGIDNAGSSRAANTDRPIDRRPIVKTLGHFLDRSLPRQGRAALARTSWMSRDAGRVFGGETNGGTIVGKPGEGSA